MTARRVGRRVPALAAGALLLGLSGCAPAPGVDRIDGLAFRQQQAVPGFDDSRYEQTDPQEIARFVALLRADHVDPATYRPRDTGGCAGGLTTRVTVHYRGTDRTARMIIDSCGRASGFEADADALFTGWRRQAH